MQYISIEDVARIIDSRGIEDVLATLADYIEADFLRWDSFEKSARLASHSRDGVIELMPTSDGELFAFKYVNGHPVNTEKGKLTVTAFGVLADVASGYPILLSEMTLTTALRTAATSAMVAKHLARPDSRTMALIGAGAQAEFQIFAFKAVLGITRYKIFDIDPHACERLVRNLAHCEELDIRIAGSLAECLADADIVTTATAAKAKSVVLTHENIRPGMHINAIGGDCPGKTELDADILRHARVVVEYPPQSRIEGEIQQLEADFPVIELWQVIAGMQPGRNTVDEVTVFDSVGFALEDFATLRFLRDAAREQGLGGTLDLIPYIVDPKNLYSLVRPNRAHGGFETTGSSLEHNRSQGPT